MHLPETMVTPVLLAGAMLCIMSIVDTLAYGVRTAGVLTRKLAISLSLFNVLVILSRFSNMFSAPLLGNLPDKVYQGQYTAAEVLTGLRIDLLFVVAGVLIGAVAMPSWIRIFSKGITVLERVGGLPRTVTIGLRNLGQIPSYVSPPTLAQFVAYSNFNSLPRWPLIFNIFVTCFYSIGVMATVLAASVDHSVAGTAILLSGIVNGIATMTLFIVVDPPAAVVVEQCISGRRPISDAKSMNLALLLTRLAGTLLALALLPPMGQYVLLSAKWVDRNFGGEKVVMAGSAMANLADLSYEFKAVHSESGELLLMLSARNTSDADVSLDYTSGQHYSFRILSSDTVVWDSAADMRSTQALESEVLEAGELLTYTASWPAVEAADYAGQALTLQAMHHLSPAPVTLSTTAVLSAARD
jgi:hypothetical protein